LFARPESPLLLAEKRLALAFQTRSSSVERERSLPISWFAKSVRAVRSSVRREFPFSQAPQPGKRSRFPLWQSANRTRPLRSFLEEAGQLVAPQQGPPPFAFARPSVQQESISVREPEVSSLSMSLIPVPSAQRVALLARKRLVFFREQRLPVSALKRPDNQISHHWQSLNELNV